MNGRKSLCPVGLATSKSIGNRRYEPLRFSGVWRFHELLPFVKPEDVVTVWEGQTLLQKADHVAKYVGIHPGRQLPDGQFSGGCFSNTKA